MHRALEASAAIRSLTFVSSRSIAIEGAHLFDAFCRRGMMHAYLSIFSDVEFERKQTNGTVYWRMLREFESIHWKRSLLRQLRRIPAAAKCPDQAHAGRKPARQDVDGGALVLDKRRFGSENLKIARDAALIASVRHIE